MDGEKLSQQLRKRVVELKTDMPGLYTETYNIVSTLVRLTPPESTMLEEVHNKISTMYNRPSFKYEMKLSQFEDLYWQYKGDPTFKVRGMPELDIYEIKAVLDKTRRDLLFYLVLLEEPKKDYGITMSGELKDYTGTKHNHSASGES